MEIEKEKEEEGGHQYFLGTSLSFRLSFLYLSRLPGSGFGFLSLSHTHTCTHTHAHTSVNIKIYSIHCYYLAQMRLSHRFPADKPSKVQCIKTFKELSWCMQLSWILFQKLHDACIMHFLNFSQCYLCPYRKTAEERSRQPTQYEEACCNGKYFFSIA